MNNTMEVDKINKKALKLVEKLKPDFCEYDLGSDFTELYYKNEVFVQVFLYDKTEGEYTNRANFNINIKNHEKLVGAVENYNKKLEEAQKKVLDESSVSKSAKRNYLYFNRVGTDLGIANFSTHVRDKRTEEQEEICEDYEENKGPYGGAFRDEMDYINWREGEGFVKE